MSRSRALLPRPGVHTDEVDVAPLLVTIRAAHHVLGISRTALYDHVLAPAGPVRTVQIGARRLVPMAELDSYTASLLTTVLH